MKELEAESNGVETVVKEETDEATGFGEKMELIKSVEEETEIEEIVVAVVENNANANDEHQIQADDQEGFHCRDHPHAVNPGGVCPVCLQVKLGKLVSSSSSSSSSSFLALTMVVRSPSSSPSPSLGSGKTEAGAKPVVDKSVNSGAGQGYYCPRMGSKRPPFLLSRFQGKKKTVVASGSGDQTVDVVFTRSKSTATVGTGRISENDVSPRKRGGFWSFLHVSSKLSRRAGNDDVCPSAEDSLKRKVSRSRSVGCGSRRFSGDFFGRIGDCALRRVESQRESKSAIGNNSHGRATTTKERARCGGIFKGFMMSSSSSSSSSSFLSSSSSSSIVVASAGASSSSNWLSPSSSVVNRGREEGLNGMKPRGGDPSRGRISRSWRWAFASPIMGLGPKRSRVIRESNNSKSRNPNRNVIS